MGYMKKGGKVKPVKHDEGYPATRKKSYPKNKAEFNERMNIHRGKMAADPKTTPAKRKLLKKAIANNPSVFKKGGKIQKQLNKLDKVVTPDDKAELAGFGTGYVAGMAATGNPLVAGATGTAGKYAVKGAKKVKKALSKKEMGGKVKYENGGPISNRGKKTFIQRDESGRPGPAFQQQQRPDIGRQGLSDAEQVERWKSVKEFDSAPGGKSVLKSQQRQAFKDVMKSKLDKAGKITSKMKEIKFRGKPEMKEGGPVAKHDKGQKGASKKKSSFIDNLRAAMLASAEADYKLGKNINKGWAETKEKIAGLSKKEKPVSKAKFKDGGAVRVHESSVHKSAGEPVTTYQASNSNYKEGK